jgi:hypothetical protein
VSDLSAIRIGDLTAGDARRLFDRFTAEGPARLEAFLDAVRDRGGPVDRLDRSLVSLEILWPWFLAAVRDPGKFSAVEPWWVPFHPPWVRALGPGGAVMATGLSEYVFACVIANAPGSSWVLSRRASSRRHPVLVIPGRGEMDYAVPLGFAVRALSGDLPADREPRALRGLVEIWLGLDVAHEAAVASLRHPIEPWAVRAIDERRFTHELSFEESVAHQRSRTITGILRALAREPGILEVVHEDREVALIRAPDRTAAKIAGLVERMWAAGDRPHGATTPDVP